MKLTHVHMKNFEEYRPYVDTMVLPIGTIEAHGPHAPLGTDVLIPRKLAEYIESKLMGRIWTAPEIAYGSTWALQDFPGSIDVPGRVFADYVHAVVSSFARWGVKNVVLLNGHGGNIQPLQEAANRLVDEGLNVWISNYWVDYRDEIKTITPGVGHGGEDETSLVMTVDRSIVDLSLAKERHEPEHPAHKYPGMGRTLYPDGYSGDPASASVEKGERLVELIGERLLAGITKMWETNS
ncbi:creatininase family protein [Tumebacillus sp. DT12]|uniref:Creatininase family protein n=1 Tax=Tumebacillus lacus TaxID=2995335 RepID=A0ABT3X1S3_9BACL|nr:creatininase family protein [Tumebacillus lacus]MCX7568654.1 creatininase family protein [Tumebacillus lacus]